MPKKQTPGIQTNNRQMAAGQEETGELFFFPKRNPPVSVRAASREDAERALETNAQEV